MKSNASGLKLIRRGLITTLRVHISNPKGLKFNCQSKNFPYTSPKSTSRGRKLSLIGLKSTSRDPKIDSLMPTIDFRRPKIYSPSAKSTLIGPKFTLRGHKATPSRCSKIYIQIPKIGSQGPKIDSWMPGLSVNYKIPKLNP